MSIRKQQQGFNSHNGHRVPFVLSWRDSKPDFQAIDPAKVRICLEQRLCGICGGGLGKKLAFIGGDKSERFIDPPNHRACAQEALKDCPFLSEGRIRDADDSGEYKAFNCLDYEWDTNSLYSWPAPSKSEHIHNPNKGRNANAGLDVYSGPKNRCPYYPCSQRLPNEECHHGVKHMKDCGQCNPFGPDDYRRVT